MKHSKVDEIRRLYWEQQFSTREIGELFGITPQGVRWFMKRYGIERRVHTPKWKPRFSNREDLAYVASVTLGDGCVNLKGGYLHLVVKDYDFCQAFAEACKRIYLQPVWGQRGKYYEVKIYSREICRYIKSLTPERLLKEFSTEKERIRFIRGFFDSEGNVTLWNSGKHVRICNSNKDLLKVVRSMIESLGIKTGFGPNGKRGGFVIRIRVKSLPDFVKLIGSNLARKARVLAQMVSMGIRC